MDGSDKSPFVFLTLAVNECVPSARGVIKSA